MSTIKLYTSVRLIRAEADEQGQQYDPQIEQQRPIVHVIEIVLNPRLHLLDGIGFTAQAVDLGPAGDARLNLWRDR